MVFFVIIIIRLYLIFPVFYIARLYNVITIIFIAITERQRGETECAETERAETASLWWVKGNVAVYKDLNLVTVTIKRYFSREHSERM